MRSLPTRRARLGRSQAVYGTSYGRLMHTDPLGGSVGGQAVHQHEPHGCGGFAGRQHARGGQGFGELAWGHLGVHHCAVANLGDRLAVGILDRDAVCRLQFVIHFDRGGDCLGLRAGDGPVSFGAGQGVGGHGGCLLGVGGLGALNQPLGKMLPVRTYGDPHDAASCAQVADAMTSIRMIFDCHIPRFAGAVTDGLQGGGKGVLGLVAHLYLLIVAVSIRYRAAIISCLIAVSSMLAKIFQTIFLTMREAG